MRKELVSKSKLLSLVLRHDPSAIGIELDENGWVDIQVLLEAMQQRGRSLNREALEEIAATNDKKRFALSDDGARIRASQGHSVEVDLEFQAVEPPAGLYHGTAKRFLDSIMEKGLLPGARQHVHLSADKMTATKVGSRHGKPVVLHVDAEAMYRSGAELYRSENGVWLTAAVPPGYLREEE